MISEAHEIRENQSYRNVNLTNLVAKQNVNEETVSRIATFNSSY